MLFRYIAMNAQKAELTRWHSFSAAYAKLLELGVPKAQFAGDPWSMGSA